MMVPSRELSFRNLQQFCYLVLMLENIWCLCWDIFGAYAGIYLVLMLESILCLCWNIFGAYVRINLVLMLEYFSWLGRDIFVLKLEYIFFYLFGPKNFSFLNQILRDPNDVKESKPYLYL